MQDTSETILLDKSTIANATIFTLTFVLAAMVNYRREVRTPLVIIFNQGNANTEYKSVVI